MGNMLPSLKCRRLLSWIGEILFRGRARRPLLLAIAVAIAPLTASADGLASVPGSFVYTSSPNQFPIPFFGAQSGTGPSVTFIDANGIVRTSQITDFDDIHPFNVFFDSARSNENVGSGAVQVLKIVWLGDSPTLMGGKKTGYKLPQPAEALRMRDWQNTGMDGGTLESRSDQNEADAPITDEATIDEPEESNAIGLAYGLGTLGTEQQMRIRAYGSVIGDSYWAADVENQVFGPKAALVWRNRRGPWSFDLQSSVLLGFNSGQVDQSSRVGTDSVPGALNRLLYMKATYSSQADERQLFTPVGELRAQSRFRLTESLSLRATWSSLLVGNLLSESGEVHFALPDTTIVVENDNMLIHQLYCGLEYVH
jgi:hypothetical protein